VADPAAPYGLAPALAPASAAVAEGQPVHAVAPPKGLSLTSMSLGLVSLLGRCRLRERRPRR
jgi:hypothetical protein